MAWLNYLKVSCISFFLIVLNSFALDNLSYLFAIDHYSQDVNQWLTPEAANYTKNLLSATCQRQRLQQLKYTYFATAGSYHAPWNKIYIESIITNDGPNGVIDYVNKQLAQFDNQKRAPEKLGYAMNYRPYSEQWIKKIAANIDMSTLNKLNYKQNNRAIATDNLLMRELPSDDPFFLSPYLPGEGYPLDLLQSTIIHAGTPLYIITATKDKSWLLVISPDYMGWVHALGIARTNSSFVRIWQKKALNNIASVMLSDTAIIDGTGQYRFTAYVGIILPVMKVDVNAITVLIPLRTTRGDALIQQASLPLANAAVLPLRATKANFAKLFTTLQQRPYGWGNLGFYNDCSSEMKSIFAMFGIYLPRNSSDQHSAGRMVDLSAKTAQQRADYLIQYALPLLTLIHIKGHIMLYVGAYADKNGKLFPLSYQELWGLSPQDRSYRAIIGKAVFLPLLLQYPEDKKLYSELYASTFELIYLN